MMYMDALEKGSSCRRLSGQSQTSAARLVHGRPHASTVRVGGAAGRRRHRGGARRRVRAARRRRTPAGAPRVRGRDEQEQAQLMQTKHRCSCCQLAASTPSEHRCTCVRVKLQRGCATEHNCVVKDVLKLFAAMQCAIFGTAHGRWNTCAHSRPTSSPRWCMHTSAHTLRKLQSSLSSM